MSITVKRKEKEPFNSFLSRYSKELRKSGIAKKHKKSQVYQSKSSDVMKKRQTLEKKRKRENAYYRKKQKK